MKLTKKGMKSSAKSLKQATLNTILFLTISIFLPFPKFLKTKSILWLATDSKFKRKSLNSTSRLLASKGNKLHSRLQCKVLRNNSIVFISNCIRTISIFSKKIQNQNFSSLVLFISKLNLSSLASKPQRFPSNKPG